MSQAEEQAFSWSVTTHEHIERSSDWYWTLGFVALVSAGLCIFFSNILLALIIVIGAVSLGVLVARGPREHSVRIDKRGIVIDGSLFQYRSIQSFWIEDDADPRLFLTTNALLTPHFTLDLETREQAAAVRTYLKKYLPEAEQGPQIAEHLAKMLGL